jgi:hypothetical protein
VNQTIKKKRAFLIGVPFENRHHEDEPLKVLQRQHTTKLEIAGGLRDVVNETPSGAGAGLHRVNRVLDNRSLCPGVRPRMEYPIRVKAVLETGDKALLCFLVISRKQKREPIQPVHVFCEESAKIFHTCVLICLKFLDLIFLWAAHGVFS